MSRIEQLIGEIEEYIDSCKFQPLSNSKIFVLGCRRRLRSTRRLFLSRMQS